MDNIYKQNVYSYKEPMWHSKGTVGQDEEGAESIYTKRMIPVCFEQRPFSIDLNGQSFESGHFAIIRVGEGKESIVGSTKGRYNLTQPLEYCQIFDKAVAKPVETLGFLGNKGERQFITWKLPNIDVYGDLVFTYGFLAVGFDGLYGEHLYVTNVRVVCNNTWNAAVADAENGKRNGAGGVYNGKHNQRNHERDLAAWMQYITTQADEYVAIHEGLFKKMEETKVSKDIAFDLFCKVYPLRDNLSSFYPDELRGEKQGTIDDYNEKQTESRNLALNLFEGAGIQIAPTAWGVLNSVTEAENHHKSSRKDTTYSILMGNRYGIMEKAMAVVSNYVTKGM